MLAEDFYHIHTSNFRKPSPVGSLSPQKPSGTPSGPNSSTSKPMRYKGPMLLPSHIYKLLSEPGIKALNSYHTQGIAKHEGTRSANLHDITPPEDKEPTSTPNEYPPSEQIPSSEPDLDNSEPCGSFTLDDSTMEHLLDHYSSTSPPI